MSSTTSTPTASPYQPSTHLSPSAATLPSFPQPQAGPSSQPYSSGQTSHQRPTRRYHSHPGCTLCSIVSAVHDQSTTVPLQGNQHEGSHPADMRSPSPTAEMTFLPRSPVSPISPAMPVLEQDKLAAGGMEMIQVSGREVVFWDEDITVLRAQGKERLCPDGRHLIVVLNRHVENIYDLGPADVPVLSHALDISRHILSYTASSSSPIDPESASSPNVRVGIVGSIARDPQSSHKHLHVHAMAGPIDTSLPGAGFYRRNVIFGSMNWWSIEDLRAEIRESTSNNRIKSGYADRGRAPIDRVPDAGSQAGLPNAMNTDPYSDSPPSSAYLRPDQYRPTSTIVPTDRKGKGPLVPRLELPGLERQMSTSSVASRGSINGDEEGYVAVNLVDQAGK